MNKNDNAEIRTPAARARIQIVEDELILAEEMRGALTALGYSVSDAVVSGEEAVRLAGETRPDLVLMDIKLRGKMDGVEAAKQILDRFNIPVIYLTAFSDDATLQRAKITEPYGYVIKPVETRELHVAVEMALHRRRLEDRLMKSERWLDATLRCIGDAVIATDDAGRVVFMNPAAEGLTGWKQVDAKGLDLTEVLRVVDGASGAPVEDPATRALREETPVGPPKKTVLIGRRGAETPIDVNCAPIRDDDGAISGVVLTFRDITERERAEEALRESEEKHRSLIVNIPDVTWTTDQEGVTTFLSPNIEAVYGYAPSEIYEAGERLWLGRIHPGDVENVTRAFEALFVDGKPFDIEYRIRRKDGEWIWAHDRSISTYEKNGMRYADGVFIDITERKRAEEALRESEEKFSTIFKLSPNALVLTGIEDGKLYEINKSFTRMFGYTKEEIEGRTSLDLKIWPNRDERKEVIEKLVEEGKLEDEEIRYGVKSGEILDAQVSAAIIKVNNNPVVLAEVMDVTEKKKAERALKKAKEAAEAANRAKSEFLANMSHELRTPLNAILGFSQLLAQCSNLDPDQKRSLGAIRRAGEHLLTLIDQVLDLAKIEAGRATLVETNFDLHALLDDTEDMFRPRARDKGLDLIFERAPDAPRCARTDEIKLRQTLFNLINNSLKFTKKGGVTVRVKTSPGVPAPGVQGGFWLTFEVADTGPGVAP
ncbi:MAG: PAS domain S-box protein, partial [Desulfobacterales bacterium]|nr:PAS domain S-box protein [Desulfobacterales bacterium]